MICTFSSHEAGYLTFNGPSCGLTADVRFPTGPGIHSSVDT